MKNVRNNHGFTLIEMLVVIAIIAVLVAIIIPVVSNSTVKAKAATDAANLRSVLAEVTTYVLFNGSDSSTLSESGITAPECKSFPDATVSVMSSTPGGLSVYYVSGSSYYGIAYFAEVAETGPIKKPKVSLSDVQKGQNSKTIKWYTLPISTQETVEDAG